MATPGQSIVSTDGMPVMGMDQDGKAQHVPLGKLDDAAWDGNGNPASLIALWKYIGVQLAAINTNTTA